MSGRVLAWRLCAVTAATACALTVLTACTGDSEAPAPTPSSGVEVTGTPLYLVDGNLGTRSIERLPSGTMTGVQGSVPGAELSEEFATALSDIDPEVTDGAAYSYAPETYDAVTLVALATQAARTDASPRIAAELREVSEGGTRCGSFEECDELLRQGEDINYDGYSGTVDFTSVGDVKTATIGLFSYDDQNLVPGYTTAASEEQPSEFVEGEVSEESGNAPDLSTVVDASLDGRLVLGALLPDPTSLKPFTPPIAAALELAVSDINEAGGVLGREVTALTGDGATDAAAGTVDSQVQQGADVVISATSSDATLSVLDQVVASGVLMVGSSQTAVELSTVDDAGLYFRTAPSDVLQGRVLADRVLAGGSDSVAILARGDAYGRGLANVLSERIEAEGAQVVDTVFFPSDASRYARQVAAIAEAEPDAVVLISFDEAGKIIEELISQGLAPNVS